MEKKRRKVGPKEKDYENSRPLHEHTKYDI